MIVYVLRKTQAGSRRSRAKTDREMYKNDGARAKLLFLLIKPFVFFDVLVTVRVGSTDLPGHGRGGVGWIFDVLV